MLHLISPLLWQLYFAPDRHRKVASDLGISEGRRERDRRQSRLLVRRARDRD